MVNDSAPEQLDWVTARAQCSILIMFKALENGIQEDVEVIESLQRKNDEVKFSVVPSARRFSVIRMDDPITSIGMSVNFVCTFNDIRVTKTTQDGELELFTAGITLNNNGQCKLTVDGVELEQWQVRRKALEELFFNPTAF